MPLHVRVLAFARARELLGDRERDLELPSGARVRDVWPALAARRPEFGALSASVRVARNGALASPGDSLVDGDELALLPPVGGG